MTRDPPSLPPAYFRDMYEADPDPWRFATSDYERRKYHATLDAIPIARPARVFEAGCSIGVLTAMLAPIAGHLLSVDVDAATLDRARAQCAGHANVEFQRMVLPGDWPEGSFDLMLYSEVLYFLSRDDVARAARQTLASLQPGGAVVLVNWTGPTNYPCGGDEAAELFIATAAPMLSVLRTRREQEYRLDVLTGPPAQP